MRPTKDEVEQALRACRSRQLFHGHDWDVADVLPVVMDLLAQDEPQSEYEDERAFHKIVNEGLVPRLEQSGAALVSAPYTDRDNPYDIRFAVELGLMILMDKPIITVQAPGATLSKKLELVSDKIVHADITTEEGQRLLTEAVEDMTKEHGSEE